MMVNPILSKDPMRGAVFAPRAYFDLSSYLYENTQRQLEHFAICAKQQCKDQPCDPSEYLE